MEPPLPLIVTQILTPKKRPDLLHRPRLVDFLHEHIDRKLLLVSASAGYGKTSLLVDYAHDTDLPVCWLSVVEAARDARVFFDHLIASINFHFPQFGAKSRHVLQSTEALSDPTILVGTLVNEIYETIPDYFVVAVDDFHLVDSSRAVNVALDVLIQHLPENCRIVISSRTVPTLTPHGLALLTAHQEIAGLGVKEMRFTAPEIQALILQNYGHRLGDAAAQELAAKSEGWITGILLTTHTMWAGLLEGMIRIQGSDSKVYEYLVTEVFDQQSPELQSFLLSTSVLQEMSPQLCDGLLGARNSRDVLKQLEDQNLFVTRLERGEERWYRYHPLFREFLQTKLHEERPQLVHQLQLNAATVLRQAGAVEQAVEHYLAVGAFREAMEAILEIAAVTYDAGRLETMARWLDALPANLVQAQPRLLWYRAKVHLETGQLEQAIDMLEHAEAQFCEQDNPLGQARSLVERSAALRLRAEFRPAIEACQKALSLVDARDGGPGVMRVVASAYRQLGTSQANLGSLSEGEQHLRMALRVYESLEYAPDIAYVHLDLGAILQLSGNLVGGELHFGEALEIWQKLGNVGLAALTINNIAIGHYYRGEHEEALRLYELGLEQARKAGLERPMAFLLAGIGDVYRDQGAYEEAMEAYEKGLELARQAREAFVIGYLLDAVGNTHRLAGDFAKAISNVREAFERAQERRATYELGLYQTSLGVICYQQGNVQQAQEYLNQARTILEQCKAQRELARACLYLAQTYHVSGRFQEAYECVQMVLNALLELGYYQFLLPVARETEQVLAHAVGRGMGDTLIGQLLTSLDAAEAPGRRSVPRSEPVSVQPLLRVHAFGESRVLNGDQLITSGEWGMAKSKELLYYLLCHKQRRKDQIGTDLWPDLSPAKLRSSFHVALYRLRRALGRPDCVRFEHDQYIFDRGTNYWFDVEEFERAARRGSQAWDSAREDAAQAYRSADVLYRGDFLEDLGGSEWTMLKREELLREHTQALARLGEYSAAEGAHREAISFYERVVQKDGYQESAWRGVMRSHALLRERSAAIRTYQRLVQLLDQELGAEPAAETAALYARILQGTVA